MITLRPNRPDRRRRRPLGWTASRLTIAGLVVTLGLARTSEAVPVGSSVSISPPLPTAADSIDLDVHYDFPTTGFSFAGSSLSFPSATEIVLDVDVSAPGPGDPVLQIVSPLDVTATIGLLAPGTYDYTVNLFETPGGPIPLRELTDQIMGSFTVVPEPGTAVLLGVGMLTVCFTARRARQARASSRALV